MNTYEINRQWSDRRMRAVKGILGNLVFEPADDITDSQEATDLVLMAVGPLRVSCRLRRPGYEQYIDEFTIRTRRGPSGKSELDKIMAGHGDWFFYGHVAPDDKIGRWMVVDLNAFRLALERAPGLGRQVAKGPMQFRCYDVKEFSHRILVARN